MSRDIDPGPRLRVSLGTVSAPSGDIGSVVRRAGALRLRRRVAGAMIAALVFTGIAVPLGLLGGITGRDHQAPIGPKPPAAIQGFAPPTFAPAPGWYVLTSGVVPFQSHDLPMALTANVPFAEQDLAYIKANGLSEAFPSATLRSLPADGVVIIAALRIDPGATGNPNFGPRALPLGLADAEIRLHWESQPAPNVPEYLLRARVDRRSVNVSVYFGTPRPGPTTLATAQGELDRLIIPAFLSGPSPSAGWITNRIGSLTIETPTAWTFRDDPVPRLIRPKIWFGVGSWPLPRGGECGPAAALQAVPRDGTLFWLLEYGALAQHLPRSDFPPQPRRFTLRGVRALPYECTGRRTYLLRFRSHGRFFQVQIAFGPDASPALRAEVLRSLSSFRAGFGAG